MAGRKERIEDAITTYMGDIKHELGFNREELVFIGMADTAEIHWCEQKSVYKNRRMELAYFGSFFDDIVNYAFELGYIDRKPSIRELSPRELLNIRRKISFDDIERLLAESKPPADAEFISSVEAEFGLLPLEPSAKGTLAEEIAKNIENIRLQTIELLKRRAPPEEVAKVIKNLPPKTQGSILEYYSERHPTIRWNFDWEGYVIIGVPDGITDRFVYEYKTTTRRNLEWIKPVAMAQADIYGYFFRRGEKRVQIMTREDGKIYTWHEETSQGNALDTLRKFKEVEKGERRATPPAEWKCRNCEFKEGCVIRG